MILKFNEEVRKEEFSCYYDISRFFYIHFALSEHKDFSHIGEEKIRKTASLESSRMNVYIDTSDGVNDDLEIDEYCGRIKRIVQDASGKPFLFFKAAYSGAKTRKIVEIADANNGKVIPFFKWFFNPNFYNEVFGKRDEINETYKEVEKEYDIGYFCGLKPYNYPKPSAIDPSISWSDHRSFNISGQSEDTGNFTNDSRRRVLDQLESSNLKVLHQEGLSYTDYIKQSYKCKVIFNPPGMGEYTSRLMDHCYLGNCVAMRANSYDQGFSWKDYIPQVELRNAEWKDELDKIIENYETHAAECRNYFDSFWNPEAVNNYLISMIEREINDKF
jgi:hypothetical protein